MKTVHKISAWALIGLGILHVSLTPLFYSSFSTDALWFAGTGLGLLFLGLFNLTMQSAPARTALDLCLIANILGFVYGILIVIALPEPQAILAVLAFLGAMIGLASTRKTILEEVK